MSVKVSAKVWDHSSQSGSALLVLLALADHSDDDGICYPGIDRVSFKARIEVRQTQRVIKKLAEAGELFIEYQKGFAGGRGYTNNFFVTVGMSAYEIEDVLKRRFDIPSDEAAQIADHLIDLQNGGSFDKKRVSRKTPKKGVKKDTQKRVSPETKRVSHRTQRVSPETQKGVIAMTPEPSRTVMNPSVNPSVVVAPPATAEKSSGEDSLFQKVEDHLEHSQPPIQEQQPSQPPTPGPPPPTDPVYAEACTLYESEIGGLSPVIAGQIKDRLKTSPIEWFRLAFAKAAAANVRRWNYVNKILINWEACGGPQNDTRRGRKANDKRTPGKPGDDGLDPTNPDHWKQMLRDVAR